MVSSVLVTTFEIVDGRYRKRINDLKGLDRVYKDLRRFGQQEAAKKMKGRIKNAYTSFERKITNLMSLTAVPGKAGGLVPDTLTRISSEDIDRLRGKKLTARTPKSFEGIGSFTDILKASLVQRGLKQAAAVELKIAGGKSLFKTREVGKIQLGTQTGSSLTEISPLGEIGEGISSKELSEQIFKTAGKLKGTDDFQLKRNDKGFIQKQYRANLNFLKKNIREIIEKTPALKQNIFQKASVISFIYESKLGIRATTLNVRPNVLSRFLIYNITDKGELIVKYPSSFIRPLLDNAIKSYDAVYKDIITDNSINVQLQSFKLLDGEKIGIRFEPGSIKVVRAPRFYSINQFIKDTEFSSEAFKSLAEYTGIFKNKLTKGRFISNLQLTELTRRLVKQRMPMGPVGGPALSPTVLTYRTGRFVDSIKVYADYVRNTLAYSYMVRPYGVHEMTRRDPRRLIREAIRTIAIRQFGRNFRVQKM